MNRTREPLTIGQLARRAGVGVETIRFYERRGLLEEPPRLPSGYRQYPPEAVRRLRFIRRAQELGFSLREIADLLSLRVDPDTTCGEILERTRAKIVEIERKIASLERMRAALERVARRCRGRGPTSECPILDEMDRADEETGGARATRTPARPPHHPSREGGSA